MKYTNNKQKPFYKVTTRMTPSSFGYFIHIYLHQKAFIKVHYTGKNYWRYRFPNNVECANSKPT